MMLSLPRLPYRLSLIAPWLLFDALVLSLFRGVLALFYAPADASLGQAFWLGLRFDLQFLGALYLFIYLVTFIPRLMREGRWQAYLWQGIWFLISFAIIFVYGADLGHFSYLGSRIDAAVINTTEDPWLALQFAWENYPLVWFSLLALSLSGLWSVAKWWWLRRWRLFFQGVITVGGRWRWLVAVFYCFLGGITLVGLIHGNPTSFISLRWTEAEKIPSRFAAQLAFNPVLRINDTLIPRLPRVSLAAFQEAERLLALHQQSVQPLRGDLAFDKRYRSRKGLRVLPTVGEGKASLSLPSDTNVVVLVMESYAAQRTSFFGNPLGRSEAFDAIAREGVLFTRFFSNGTVTMRGDLAILSSIPDVNADWVTLTPGLAQQSSLINAFGGHSKHFFFPGDSAWGGLSGYLRRTIPDLQIHERGDLGKHPQHFWGISDKTMLLETNRWLGQEKQPFFAVLQTVQNHPPYYIFDDERALLPTVLPPLEQLQAQGFRDNKDYLAWLNFNNALAAWVKDVRQQPWFRRTLFVLLGDHAEGLSASARANNFVYSNGIQNFHIPLLLWAPGLLKPEIVNRVGSQVDVLPTIAGLLGVNTAGIPSLGRSLFAEGEDEGHAFMFQGGGGFAFFNPPFFARGSRDSSPGSFMVHPVDAPGREKIEPWIRAIDTVARWHIEANPERKP